MTIIIRKIKIRSDRSVILTFNSPSRGRLSVAQQCHRELVGR